MNLYPYQVEGAKWLASRDRALLADEMGLGKTAQAIAAADIIQAKTILVVCPASARFVWKDAINQFSWWGHDIHVMTSGDDKPIKGMVNIVNYDLLARGFYKNNYQPNAFLKRMKAVEWDALICDESHYLKEQNSLRTIAVLGSHGLNGHTKRLWLLTGTPMPNQPGELWTMLCALGATDLEYVDFIKRYCTLGKYGFSLGKPNGTNPANADELNKILRGVMTRRYKEFVLPQLPPIRIDDMPVPEIPINIPMFFEEALADKKLVLAKIHEQEEFVRQVWKRSIASDGLMDTRSMITTLEAIGPSVGLYRRWLGAVKAASFAPIVAEELETGAVKKIVIFAHHKQVIAFMKAKLEKFGVVVVDGSGGDKEKAVFQFQNNPDVRVFLGSSAAYEALTLTAAHEVVILEASWVPSQNAQAVMRTHRIGQHHAVRARFVRLADTLDDYITEVLARKTREITSIVDK